MSHHKELLAEMLQDWTVEKVDNYIQSLLTRREELDDWIRHVRSIRKTRTKKMKLPLDNGARGGKG